MPQPPGQAPLAAIDERIYRAFRSALHDRPHTERVILALTRAQHCWPVAGLAATVVDRKHRSAWTRANTAVGGAWAAAKLTSRIVRRPRPNLTDCPPARRKTDRESFPSTHTTVIFAAAVALPPLLPPTPLIYFATATATTRLLLGEHYPSDVAAGAALGAALAAPLARSGKHDPQKRAVPDRQAARASRDELTRNAAPRATATASTDGGWCTRCRWRPTRASPTATRCDASC